MNDKKVWIIIGSSLLILCLCSTAIVAAVGVGVWQKYQETGETTNNPGLEVPLPAVTQAPEEETIAPVPPNATQQPASSEALLTLENLRAAQIPVNDPLELTERLKGYPEIPQTVEPNLPYKVGDRETFWASNSDTDEIFRVNAVLREVVDSAYFWVEDGISYRESDLSQLAQTFDEEIYPTNRAFFGNEWTPGIDGDPHLYILYANNLGDNVAAYFSSIDSVNPVAHTYSNAHEMFMVNADTVSLGESYTYGVLAHEFQHMIHWNQDRNEDTWVNEGFSELAAFLNGYDPGGFDYLFSLNTDMQLTDWPFDPDERSVNYGSSFLFMAYFLDRFGDGATQALVANPDNSMDSVDAVLADLEAEGAADAWTGTGDDLFVDWTVANYLNDPDIENGRYAYHRYANLAEAKETETIGECNGEWQQRSVSQYGADYIRLDCPGPVELTFQGASEVGVLPEGAHSGKFAFWSNMSDESDTSLYQTFDLTRVEGPVTFEYSIWYNLEQDYDYVYLSASVDGEHWTLLKPPSCNFANPTGNNYGCGYTGDSEGYIDEIVDLSHFAGEKVTLRFDYVTDAAIIGEGLLVDDMKIPQIGYASDFESDAGGWQAQGFVRIDNRLPQTFRVTIIEKGRNPSVRHVDLNEIGGATITIDHQVNQNVTVVVSGTTRFTRQKASYGFSVKQQ